MDPADLDRVKEALSNQGQLLGNHDQLIKTLIDSVAQISDQLTALNGASPSQPPPPPAVAAPAPPANPPAEPHIPPPAKYSGNPDTCRNFLTQVRLVFNAQPVRYQQETAKIAYVASLLEGPPLTYFNALYEQGSPAVQSFFLLETELKRVYDHPIRGQQAGQQLLRLRQGRRSVREFASEFRSLAVESGWNDQALLTAFQSGLNRTIGREIALRQEQLSLDAAITTAIRISDQMAQWLVEPSPLRPAVSPVGANRVPPALLPSEAAGATGEEPMQVGRTQLSPEERQRRMSEGRCLYCGQLGHIIATCPLKARAHK